MSLRVIVMRHAKSSWATADLDDHARPLNDRGKASTAALGQWLVAKGYVPDQVLSSDAQRTRDTWGGLAPGLGVDLTPDWRSDLYLAGAGAIFSALRGASGRVVLILGHNPGIAAFASGILAEPPTAPGFADYPTGATLVADFPVENWASAAPGTAGCMDFVVPRALIE